MLMCKQILHLSDCNTEQLVLLNPRNSLLHNKITHQQLVLPQFTTSLKGCAIWTLSQAEPRQSRDLFAYFHRAQASADNVGLVRLLVMLSQESPQVADVRLAGVLGPLHLNRRELVVTLDDEIYLHAVPCPQENIVPVTIWTLK